MLLARMRDNNPLVERCAYVVSGDTFMDMQVERLIHAAQSHRRRAFYFPSQAVRWLAECLTDAETNRARAFLLE